MTNFAGRLTQDVFTRTQWLSTPRFVRWFGWFLLLCLLTVLATGGWRTIAEDPLHEGLKFIPIALFTLIMFFAPRRAIKKTWEKSPLLHEPVQGSISAGGVAWKTPVMDSFYAWDKILRSQITAETALLYLGPRQALILPKEWFESGAAWEEALETLRQHSRVEERGTRGG